MNGDDELARGFEHHRAGRLTEAAACYARVLTIEPRRGEVLHLLGVTAHQSGDHTRAIALITDALALAADDDPWLGDAHYHRGLAQRAVGEVGQAIVGFQRSLARNAERLDARGALVEALAAAGCAERDRQHYVAAIEYFREVLEWAPEWHEAQHNLAHMLFVLGHVDEAVALFRRAAAGLTSALPRSMIACVIPGAPASDNQDVLDARTTYANRDLPRPRAVARRRHGRIRLGYVSSFFHRENWMKPVWGLINHHDRERFDIALYSDAPASKITHGYRPRARDVYVDISPMPSELVADRIEADGIDILIDLNGYSAVPRLSLVALKPAPVLVGWFNHFATTGLGCYDCLIGDRDVIPPDEERLYRERIVRVPGSYLTFEVAYPVPDIVARTDGPITFGCLAPQYKITPQVIAAWCRILREAPDARLVLKSTALAQENERRYVHRQFAEHGVRAERVRLEGPADHYDFLRTYDSIDLALDTFPYNGGTTTTEAIWQGVPVVTYWGDRWVARTSASILRAAGLGEYVMPSVDDYVAAAVRMAQAPDTPRALTELRLTMRERLARSPVCDTPGFARSMEQIYADLAT